MNFACFCFGSSNLGLILFSFEKYHLFFYIDVKMDIRENLSFN